MFLTDFQSSIDASGSLYTHRLSLRYVAQRESGSFEAFVQNVEDAAVKNNVDYAVVSRAPVVSRDFQVSHACVLRRATYLRIARVVSFRRLNFPVDDAPW